MKKKRWIYSYCDWDTVMQISQQFKISPLVAGIIINRNIISPQEIQLYLKKDITGIHDPFLMKDMDKAVERIQEAIEKKERITIYGDYDVDGITSTSIMVRYLNGCGALVDYYIPDRIDEGYGINKEALNKIRDRGTRLIITVDSGITAVEEVDYAREMNIDIIITDHHECKTQIPNANAVINPKQKDCTYPFKDLAGVGVAFKLIQALAGKDSLASLIEEYMDIVCLGTIADVVPLTGENRIIVYKGLEQISRTKNIGLNALIKISGLEGKKINTGNVGFIIAPRINAAGRIGSALRAVELFMTDNRYDAEKIARELNDENKNRQAAEAKILEQAMQMIEKEYDLSKQKVIVLANENWHHGVIGIVASRITDKFYRPSILISLDSNDGKGSGRSIKGFNLFEALTKCSKHLTKFGGHELAAGLSISKDEIAPFIDDINAIADEQLQEEDLVPPVYIDYIIDGKHISLDTVEQLEKLEPFGIGNAAPVFAFLNARITDIRPVGSDKHLKLSLKKEDTIVDAIGFNMGDYVKDFIAGDIVDVACSMEVNSYNGNNKVQLVIKDIKFPDEDVMSYYYYKTFHIDERSDIIGNIADNSNKCTCNVEKSDFSFLKECYEAGKRCLVLVNTLSGYQKLYYDLNRINKMKCSYYFDTIKQTGRLDVLVNPDVKNLNTVQYDCIFLYDPCFSIDDFQEISKKCNNMHILFNAESIEWCRHVLDNIIPERKQLVMVYQFVKSRSYNGVYSDNLDLLVRRISVSYNTPFNIRMLLNILGIFEELSLFKVIKNPDEEVMIQLCPHQGTKINIEESSRLLTMRRWKNQLMNFEIYMKNNINMN